MMTNLLLYLLIGAIAGTASGLLGVGGGVLAVPLLDLMFIREGFPVAIDMHMAIGTSITAAIVTSTTSMYAHSHVVDNFWVIAKKFLPGIVIGVIIGALFADVLYPNTLRIIFGVLVLLLAVHMSLALQLHSSRTLPGQMGINLASTIIGIIAGLTGLGCGAIGVPYMTYYSVPMRKAVAAATVIISVAAFAGSIMFIIIGLNEANLPRLATGYVYWPAVLGIILASPLFAVLATKYSQLLSTRTLRRIFAIMLLSIGIHMLFFRW